MPGYLRSDAVNVFEENSFDSVNKLRTASPQALIDTDFEYGMQISKWENLGLVNNRPFSYPSSNVIPNITGIGLPENSTVVTVTTSDAHGLSVGSSISVQDTFLSLANGNFIIETVTDFTFTYRSRALNITPPATGAITELFDSNKTAIYLGTVYTGAAVGGALTLTYTSNKAITVTTTNPHGLSLGNEFAISGVTADTNAPNGSFFVARIINALAFVYYAPNLPTGSLVATSAKIYVRPQAQFLHRPFDGGVLFSANASSNNQQAIRQTRRYFRYQSGKGIQISSGTILKPNLSIESLTASGNIITVQTKEQHNMQPGSTVRIFGANEPDYNSDSQPGGVFVIVEILGYNLFQVIADSAPFESKASGNYYVTIDSWYGCSNKIGMFDEQNGIFFEFDGQELYVVRRSSTYQISGKLSVDTGSNTVTQTNAAFPTNFARQLDPGDFIVIRGQSYRVESISNNQTMTISPSYRGASADYVLAAKTVDTKIKQSDWNLDTMDGLGPSGYNLDLTKMQMFYIDYSWYGAGYIRWGLRGVDGNIKYVHKLANNNVNAEAYMRSGNVPARYESNTFAKTTTMTAQPGPFLSATTSALNVKSTEGFATSGTLLIRGDTTYEYINYSGKTSTSFTGLTRAKAGVTTNVTIQAGSNIGTVVSTTGIQVGQRVIHPSFPQNTYVAQLSGSTVKFNTAAITTGAGNILTDVIFSAMASTTAQEFAYSPETPVSIEQAYPTFSASISHWGTSVIMDGGFDNDKSLIFTFGQTTTTTIPKSTTVTGRTGTGTKNSKTITVNSGTGIVSGMSVSGVGVQEGTVVTKADANTITISLPLIAALSTTALTFSGGNQKALFSIRVAPSVDNGISALFGQRELINRMQLTLKSVGVSTSTPNSNLLVTAILNGVPTTQNPWTNIIKNSKVLTNSSLSQIADYSVLEIGESSIPNETIILGGEVTGGFYVQGTSSIGLEDVRDLGNSILGGGENNANTNVYPDGPDVLSIVVTNLSEDADVKVVGRLSWAEAQA
jgi:hypothetical protein